VSPERLGSPRSYAVYRLLAPGSAHGVTTKTLLAAQQVADFQRVTGRLQHRVDTSNGTKCSSSELSGASLTEAVRDRLSAAWLSGNVRWSTIHGGKRKDRRGLTSELHRAKVVLPAAIIRAVSPHCDPLLVRWPAIYNGEYYPQRAAGGTHIESLRHDARRCLNSRAFTASIPHDKSWGTRPLTWS